MQETLETWVQSLGQKDSLEEGTATHSSILAWEIPWTEGAWWAIVHRVTKESHMTEVTYHTQKGVHLRKHLGLSAGALNNYTS